MIKRMDKKTSIKALNIQIQTTGPLRKQKSGMSVLQTNSLFSPVIITILSLLQNSTRSRDQNLGKKDIV